MIKYSISNQQSQYLDKKVLYYTFFSVFLCVSLCVCISVRGHHYRNEIVAKLKVCNVHKSDAHRMFLIQVQFNLFLLSVCAPYSSTKGIDIFSVEHMLKKYKIFKNL